MAEEEQRIPDAWVGSSVTVKDSNKEKLSGELEDISDRGVVILDNETGRVFLPWSSVVRIREGGPKQKERRKALQSDLRGR